MGRETCVIDQFLEEGHEIDVDGAGDEPNVVIGGQRGIWST